MGNVLDEYLVKLGFTTDDKSFEHLSGVLAAAERTTTLHASGMAKRLLEAQGAIVGAFTAVSAAIVGTMDKVAMADQGYRLMGLRMLMTTDSARKMDLITKALGADINQIVWDPELHSRAVLMAQDIDKMSEALGGDFAGKMKGIRDIRFEFSRLEVATKFLGMSFASKLFEKLVPGEAGDKIKNFVTWFEEHIPEIADKLSDYAVPILKQTWAIIQEVGEVLKAAGLAFTNFVGLLSGDSSIQGTAFSFDKMAKAIGHVGEWMTKFFSWIAHAEELLAHFASATSLMLSGKWSEAGKEFKAGLMDLGGGSGAILGALTGSLTAGGVGSVVGGFLGSAGGPLGTAAGATLGGTIGSTLGVPIGALLGYGSGKAREWLMPNEEHETERVPAARGQAPAAVSAQPLQGHADVIAAITAAADKYHVPQSLALAVAQQESRFHQEARSRVGAIGVMQLMPKTAEWLKVNAYDAMENIEGGVKYLSYLLKRYAGDSQKAVAAYNAGQGRVDRAGGIDNLPAETRAYVPSVLHYQRDWSEKLAAMQTPALPAAQPTASNQTTSVDVGGVFITQPNADAYEIRRAVADGVRKGLEKQTRMDLAQLSPAYSG